MARQIHAVADFTSQKAAEEAELKEQPAIPGRTKYGGWLGGPQLDATGFFRVEKYRGKWSFVDPEGRLFLSFGPTGLGPSSPTIIKGRESLFSVLPGADPALASSVSKDGKQIDLLRANLLRKYGEDFKDEWYARSYERFKSWGFNTVAAFSSWETLKNGRVPYVATLWPADKHARLATGKEQVRAMHDPYDPQFAVDVAGAVQAQASRIGDDPYFIGYFLGNEEHWGNGRGGPRSHFELVLAGLKLKAAESPAKRAFLAQLQEKYAGDLKQLNAVWDTKFPDWAAMEAPVTVKDDLLSEAIQKDFSVLLAGLADQYFRVVNEEIKKVDPHHLYLGCRFAGYSPEVVAAAAKHTDVMSFNLYRLEIDPREFTTLDEFDKPVVIGEFHFGATDRGSFDVGLFGVKDQEGRGKAYQRYVRSVLAHPKFIGAHWFQYTDQAPTGRPMDGENGNVGLVSITDTPFPELTQAAREIHTEMYDLRFGK